MKQSFKLRKATSLVFFIINLAGFPPLFSSETPPDSVTSLQKFLPHEEETEGWKRDGLPQEYRGEDLYLYIDGGAAIYHEYGFKQVIVQDYRNERGKSLCLEIFEMAGSESAYGIYTYKSSPQGKQVALGQEGQLEDYYLNYWKGNYLITITGFDREEETFQGLLKIAHRVNAKIKVSGSRPALVELLPEKDLLKSSIKYFKGHLGLFASYSFFTSNEFALEEGVRGDYLQRYSLYIIPYKRAEQCQIRFTAAAEAFKNNPKYKNLKIIDSTLAQLQLEGGRALSMARHKQYILIVLGEISPGKSKDVLLDLRKTL